MNQKRNKQAGFGAVEAVLVLIIAGLLGVVGWLAYRGQHKLAVTRQATTTAVSATASTSAADLKITQVGIELPLSSNLSGLYYRWDGSQAWLFSPAVDKYASEQDPANCTPKPTGLDDHTITPVGGGQDYQEIGLIYKGSGGPEGRLRTVTVNGQIYTLNGAAGGCSANPNMINELKTYEAYLEDAFANAQALH